MAVVLPAPFGPRKPKTSAGPNLHVEIDERLRRRHSAGQILSVIAALRDIGFSRTKSSPGQCRCPHFAWETSSAGGGGGNCGGARSVEV